MFEDPKEPKDAPDEVDLDEDVEDEAPEEETEDTTAAEDEDEDATETDQDEDSEFDEEPEPEKAKDEVDELPDDPKVLKQLIRKLGQPAPQPDRRQPPTDDKAQPNELAEAFEELAKTSPAAAKLIAHLAEKQQRDQVKLEQQRRDEKAFEKIPAKHQSDVRAIMERFDLPAAAAHAYYIKALWDRAQARKAKRETTAQPEEKQPKGKAPLTRPVRQSPTSPTGGGGVLVVSGMRLKTKYKPSEYEKLMDSLPPAKKKVVFGLKSAGKISVE